MVLASDIIVAAFDFDVDALIAVNYVIFIATAAVVLVAVLEVTIDVKAVLVVPNDV